MRAFLITTFWVCLAYAKPQYNYPAPAQFPSISSSFGSTSQQSSFIGNSAISNDQRIIGPGGSSASVSNNFVGGGAAASSGGTLVQKHIYVHVAPPEPEELRPQRPISAGQSTKHYKIIFIKAPSYDYQQQQILQAQARNEEKTLVYVLVKKPDDVADISLPTAAPTAPSKPEVYFIRYKAKSEVTGGGSGIGVGVGGPQLIGGGTGIGSSTLTSGPSSGSSSFNLINTGSSSSSVSVGRPATSYGPPGQSGPY